ncbi:hypothetical protein HKX48_009511 [Thoreauomyces humboldtii]|nr:hypothetical protein HKX48_009511 [Thoreauomyces humboldtii]
MTSHPETGPLKASTVRLDPFKILPTELSARILGSLSDLTTLESLPKVSRLWRTLTDDLYVWRTRLSLPSTFLERSLDEHTDEEGPLLSHTRLCPTPHRGQEAGTDDCFCDHLSEDRMTLMTRHAARFLECVDKPKDLFMELTPLTFLLAEPDSLCQLISKGVGASSEDDVMQGIDAALDPSPRRFWSSKGSDSDASTEWLTFELRQPVCLIQSVTIRPYKATYQRGMPTYAPRTLEIAVGVSTDPEGMHFWTPAMHVDNVEEEQVFVLTPSIAVGGFLHLRMAGRSQRQPGDQLWYTVLQSVSCMGLPLGLIGRSYPVTGQVLARYCQGVRRDLGGDDQGDEDPATRAEALRFQLKTMQEDVQGLADTLEQAQSLRRQIRRCAYSGNWTVAATLTAGEAIDSPVRSDRSITWLMEEALTPFHEPPRRNDIASRATVYLDLLYQENTGPISGVEAAYFAHTDPVKSTPMLRRCIDDGRVECTEALGDAFFADGQTMLKDSAMNTVNALLIYARCNAFHGMVECFLELGQYETALQILDVVSLSPDEVPGDPVFDSVNGTEPGVPATRWDYVAFLQKILVRKGKDEAAQVACLLLKRPDMRKTVLVALRLEEEASDVADDALPDWLMSWMMVEDILDSMSDAEVDLGEGFRDAMMAAMEGNIPDDLEDDMEDDLEDDDVEDDMEDDMEDLDAED